MKVTLLFGMQHAIAAKFEINKQRKWGKPDKDGVVNHVEETSILFGCNDCGEYTSTGVCENCGSLKTEPAII